MLSRSEKLALICRMFYKDRQPDHWLKYVRENVTCDSTVLEIGSGSGRGVQNSSHPSVQKIVGVDLDPRVLENPYLDEAYVLDACSISTIFEVASFDAITSHMVVEHIEHEESFIEEQLKCLKPNGVIVHSTVSGFYYSSLLNYIVPDGLKEWLVKHIGSGRTSQDIFPAFYRLNHPKRIRDLSRKYELECQIVHVDMPPGYLQRSLILMLIYTLIHKPISMLIPAVRPSMIFLLRRKC